MTIESKNYIATPEDIKALAEENLTALSSSENSRMTYLRALVGTTQADLRGAKDADTDSQLNALAAVHKRFYAAVLEAVLTPDVMDNARLKPEEKTRRALERNRRSNFARTAYSALKRWAQTHDILTLKAGSVTKASLAAESERPARARKITAPRAEKRVNTLVEKLLETTRALANSDPEAARATLDAVLQRVGRELFAGAGAANATTNPQIAMKEHRPLRAANGVFWPTETQVIRRQRLKAA